MILLDTHILIWSRSGDARLGPRAREQIEQALAEGELAVSAISFWEAAMLHEKRRFTLLRDVASWRDALIAEGLAEIPIDGAIAARAGRLTDMHGDPADRLIVATALDGHRLLTADQPILDWPGSLDRLDGRA